MAYAVAILRADGSISRTIPMEGREWPKFDFEAGEENAVVRETNDE